MKKQREFMTSGLGIHAVLKVGVTGWAMRRAHPKCWCDDFEGN